MTRRGSTAASMAGSSSSSSRSSELLRHRARLKIICLGLLENNVCRPDTSRTLAMCFFFYGVNFPQRGGAGYTDPRVHQLHGVASDAVKSSREIATEELSSILCLGLLKKIMFGLEASIVVEMSFCFYRASL